MKMRLAAFIVVLTAGVVFAGEPQGASQTGDAAISGRVLRAGSSQSVRSATVTLTPESAGPAAAREAAEAAQDAARAAEKAAREAEKAARDAAKAVAKAAREAAKQAQEAAKTAEKAAKEASRNAVQAGIRETVTGVDGAFAFEGVRPGRYRIAVSRDGFLDQEYGQASPAGRGSPVAVRSGERLTSIDFQMVQAGVIVGVIVDEDSYPMPGVEVQALTYEYRSGQRFPVQAASAITNDLGQYRLFWLAPGEYFVAALPRDDFTVPEAPLTGPEEKYAVSYYPGGTVNSRQAAPVAVTAALVRNIDFMIRPVTHVTVSGAVVAPVAAGAANSGKVQDAARLVRDARVVLAPLNPNHGYWDGAPETSAVAYAEVAPDGAFKFSNVLPGTYDVVAVAVQDKVQRTAVSRVEVGNRNVEKLSLSLRAGADVPGHITVDGAPPANFRIQSVQVILTPADDLPVDSSKTKSNPDGSFVVPGVAATRYHVSLSGLPPGGYLIGGRYASGDALNRVIDIQAQGAIQLQIGFSSGHVSATIIDIDEPSSGSTAVLVPRDRGRVDLYRTAVSNSAGKVLFPHIAPGDYKLFAGEAIELDAFQDPAYLRRVEDRGREIRVEKNGSVTETVQVIRRQER